MDELWRRALADLRGRFMDRAGNYLHHLLIEAHKSYSDSDGSFRPADPADGGCYDRLGWPPRHLWMREGPGWRAEPALPPFWTEQYQHLGGTADGARFRRHVAHGGKAEFHLFRGLAETAVRALGMAGHIPWIGDVRADPDGVIDPAFIWSGIVHRVAWDQPADHLLHAERLTWIGSKVLPFDADEQAQLFRERPTLRSYLERKGLSFPADFFCSVLPTDLFQCSAWAIDSILGTARDINAGGIAAEKASDPGARDELGWAAARFLGLADSLARDARELAREYREVERDRRAYQRWEEEYDRWRREGAPGSDPFGPAPPSGPDGRASAILARSFLSGADELKPSVRELMAYIDRDTRKGTDLYRTAEYLLSEPRPRPWGIAGRGGFPREAWQLDREIVLGLAELIEGLRPIAERIRDATRGASGGLTGEINEITPVPAEQEEEPHGPASDEIPTSLRNLAIVFNSSNMKKPTPDSRLPGRLILSKKLAKCRPLKVKGRAIPVLHATRGVECLDKEWQQVQELGCGLHRDKIPRNS